MTEIILGVALFTVVILALVMIILFARKQLVATGDVTININDDADKSITTEAGGKLLGALANNSVSVK